MSVEIKRLVFGKVYESCSASVFVERKSSKDGSNKKVTVYDIWGRTEKSGINTILTTVENTFDAKVFIECFLNNAEARGY